MKRTSLFTNYDNTPSNFVASNSNTYKLNNNIPKKPLAEYNAKGELIGYSWNYGDEVTLEFTTNGVVTSDDNTTPLSYNLPYGYFTGKKMKLQIFDANYNEVYTKTKTALQQVYFNITKDFYTKKLFRGIYRLKLTLLDTTNNTNTVLFDLENGTIFIR